MFHLVSGKRRARVDDAASWYTPLRRPGGAGGTRAQRPRRPLRFDPASTAFPRSSAPSYFTETVSATDEPLRAF
jgi:hypothetical protein